MYLYMDKQIHLFLNVLLLLYYELYMSITTVDTAPFLKQYIGNAHFAFS
jgi:hypothetical protein